MSTPPSSPSPHGDDSPDIHNRYLAAFMALSVLVGTSNGISRVCLPLFAASLHAAAWQIGLVGGLQYAGMLLLSMPLGALIDRHGSRPLFRIGATAAAAVFLLGITQVSEPWQLIACVALLGLSIPFRIVPTQTEFLHLLPSLGPMKAGWNRGSHTLGMFFIGPTLGAFLIVAMGFAPTFAIVGAGLLLTLVIGNRVLKTAPPGRGIDATPLRLRVREQFALMAERPALRRTMLIDFCGQMALSYFSVFIVLVGIRSFGMSTQQAAGLITLQGALFVGTLFAGGVVLARVNEERCYMLAFMLLLAYAALMFAPPSQAWLWAGSLCLGLGLGVQHLTSVNRFGSLMRELGRGKVGGMSSLAGPAGGLTGATMGGLLSQHFGMMAGFRVLAAVYTLQCVMQWRRLSAMRAASA